MVMGGQDQGIFPLTLIPSWESIHHFADLAVIGSFLLTVAALYLAPPPPSQTPVQTRDNGVAQPIGRLSIRRLRRPAMLTLAFVFGFLTIGLFVYTRQPAPRLNWTTI